MEPNSARVRKAVREYCRVTEEEFPDESVLVDWGEVSSFLQMEIKACQVAVQRYPLWLVQSIENLRFVMVGEPPDEFAILRTTTEEILRYRDYGDIPDVWILTVGEYASLRREGPVMWERFVDLKARFPEFDNVQDGDLELDTPTRARFFPVCIDRRWLQVRNSIRQLERSVQRSNAVRCRWHPQREDTNFY